MRAMRHALVWRAVGGGVATGWHCHATGQWQLCQKGAWRRLRGWESLNGGQCHGPDGVNRVYNYWRAQYVRKIRLARETSVRALCAYYVAESVCSLSRRSSYIFHLVFSNITATKVLLFIDYKYTAD